VTEYAVRYGDELVLDKSWTCVSDVVASYHGGFAEGGRVTGVLLSKEPGDIEWKEAAA
jgi:hypothetical protein